MEVLPFGLLNSKDSLLIPYGDNWAVTDAWTTSLYPKTEAGLKEALEHIKEDELINNQLRGRK